MPQFRKKPVVIDAVQYLDDGESIVKVLGFLMPEASIVEHSLIDSIKRQGFIPLQTLEGEMRATPGDWIIKGVKGEFYPCKPDIFAATYEDAAASTQKISGYRELTQEELDLINEIKAAGDTMASLILKIDARNVADQHKAQSMGTADYTELALSLGESERWKGIARTHLQQGLMALTRSVARPKGFA